MPPLPIGLSMGGSKGKSMGSNPILVGSRDGCTWSKWPLEGGTNRKRPTPKWMQHTHANEGS